MTLKKGDMVVMHTCLEAELLKYKDKVWTSETDEFTAKSGTQFVYMYVSALCKKSVISLY